MAAPQASNVPAPPSVDRSKCSDKGKQIVTADTNLDKKPDVWKFFATVQQNGQSVSVLSCKQVDLNHDGKVDVVSYYDETGNQMTLEEADLDFDGKFDVTIYYVNGKKVREEDGHQLRQEARHLDSTTRTRSSSRIERDTDFNGKVDEWQYYEGGKLDRIGYDTTGTGRLDSWDRAPEGEAPSGEPGGAPAATPPAGATQPGPAATAPPPATSPPPATQTAKK